jgi:DNA-binding transcriptional MerR regulator
MDGMSEQSTYTLAEIEDRTGFDRRTISYYVQQGLLPKVGRRGPKTRYPQLFLDRLQFVRLVRTKQDQGEIGSLTLAEIRGILERVPEEMIGDVIAGREPLQAVAFPGQNAMPAELAPADPVPEGPAPLPPRAFPEARRFEDRLNGEPAPQAATGSAQAAPVMGRSMDMNRKVRLGAMDANSQLKLPKAANTAATSDRGSGAGAPATASMPLPELDMSEEDATPAPSEPAAPPKDDPERVAAERLGWSLARLQRALTNLPRRNRGNTESWHRARITPELTISARNLPDEQAYLLDNVSRILKKLLWEAWEE